MKKIILLMFILYPVFMYGQKTAYLYGDSVMLAIPEYGIRVMKLDSMKQGFQKEIEAKQELLQQQYTNLINPYAPKENEGLAILKKRMSTGDTLRLNVLLDENVQIQNMKVTYDRILQVTYTQEIQPILNKVSTLISEYASKNHLSAVYSMEHLKMALIYIDPKQDITSVIIEKLKQKQ